MGEQHLAIEVECYAGHRGEQTPRTLILAGRRIAVAEVLDAWLATTAISSSVAPTATPT
jgi:hypothetical protein